MANFVTAFLGRGLSAIGSALDYNQATLSGAIDIIAVPRPDGSLQSTPFHVRFGKIKLLRATEKQVIITINGEKVPVMMKCGSTGAAYFVEETEDIVDAGLQTSPLASPTSSPGLRPRAPGATPSSLDLDGFQSDENMGSDVDNMGSDGEAKPEEDRARRLPVDRKKKRKTLQKWDWGMVPGSPPPELAVSPGGDLASPRSDSESPIKEGTVLAGQRHDQEDGSSTAYSPEIQSPPCGSASDPCEDPADRPVEDCAGQPAPNALDREDETPVEVHREPAVTFEPEGVRRIGSMMSMPSRRGSSEFDDGESNYVSAATSPTMKLSASTGDFPALGVLEEDGEADGLEAGPIRVETAAATGEAPAGSGDAPKEAEHEPDTATGRAAAAAACGAKLPGWPAEFEGVEVSLCGQLLTVQEGGASADDIAKDNGIFTQHMLAFDQLAADPSLFFNPSLRFRFAGQLPPFHRWEVAYPVLLSYVMFKQPLPQEAGEVLSSLDVGSLPAAPDGEGAESKKEDLADGQASGGLFSWLRRGGAKVPDAEGEKRDSPGEVNSGNGSVAGESEGTDPAAAVEAGDTYVTVDETEQSTGSPQKAVRRFRKTLNPPRGTLENMNLKPGGNIITFTVNSSLQGEQTVQAHIFLWPMHAKIVVSDIDGTITRSDVMGHLMPIVGRDWSQPGVTKLLTRIRKNGYHIMYLSSRGIGLAGRTRGYLQSVKQATASSRRGARGPQEEDVVNAPEVDDDEMLPDGPIILAPDRLSRAFKREMGIDGRPYQFKIAALRDVRNLYPNHHNCFYCGLGNRQADQHAYLHAGIPAARIFIINASGQVHGSNSTYCTSYPALTELADSMFPPLTVEDDIENTNEEDAPVDDAYNTFNFWRATLDFDAVDDADYSYDDQDP